MRFSVKTLTKVLTIFLFILPLLFLPLDLEWFETPKEYFVTITALICIPFILKERYNLRDFFNHKITLCLFSLFLVLILSSIANGFFGYSFLGTPFRKDGLLSIWSIFTIFIAFYISIKNNGELKLTEAFKASALLVSILGIIQYLLGYATIWNGDWFFDGRITSTLGQPNFLSAFLLTSLPYFIKRDRNHIFGLLTILLCLFLTFSRLNLVLILLAFVFGIFSVRNKYIKVPGTALLGITVIGALLFFTQVDTEKLYRKVQLDPKYYQLQRNLFFLSKEQLYGEKRFAIYASGIEAFKERPILGYGKAMVEPAIRNKTKAYPVLDTYIVDSTHNIFLDLAIEGGVIALLLFSTIVVLILTKLSKPELWKHKYSFLLLLISSQFFITSIVGYIWLSFLFAMSIESE